MTAAANTRILFVCGANTCRSPIAVALARNMFGDTICAESAGVVAYGEAASAEAIRVLDDQFGIDITSHRPMDVEDVSLSDFDYVVAMKPCIGDDLASRFGLPAAKTITWDVDDPAGGGVGEYRRCVDEITVSLRKMGEQLGIAPH